MISRGLHPLLFSALLSSLVGVAHAAPTSTVASDVPWMPLPTASDASPWASARLDTDADLEDPVLERLLDGGYPLRSAPIWRVPADRIPELREHPSVRAVWGLPAISPPPDDADIPPETPNFQDRQSWRAELGVEGLAWWPDGTGAGTRIGNVEYDIDPTHEDLANNPPLTVAGRPLDRFVYHGNAAVGLAAASDDGFGITGGAPQAEVVILHPIFGETYDVARAVEAAALHLEPGDVLLIEQQVQVGSLGLGPVTAEPGTWSAVRALVDQGIHVVEPAGNGAVNLDDPSLSGWFGPDNDPGSILVGASRPESRVWNQSSSYGSRVHLFAQGGQLTSPSAPDGRVDAFFGGDDPRQAYTHRFGGTSGASAQIAGLVAAVQAIARAEHGAPTDPATLRSWLVSTGRSQDPSSAADHPIGVMPDARRAIRSWVAW